MSSTGNRAGIGPTQIGTLILALATAGIHLFLFVVEGFLGTGTMLRSTSFFSSATSLLT